MSTYGCPPAESWNKLNIFFIRHAESNNNCIYDQTRASFGSNCSEDIILSEYNRLHHHDCEISPRGQLQATMLGEFIKKGGIPALNLKNSDSLRHWKILTSPMIRCLQTAQQVSIGLNNKEVIVMPNLHEQDGCYRVKNNGETEGIPGLCTAEIQSKYPQFKCAAGMEKGWYNHTQKESTKQYRERSVDFVQWLWEQVNECDESQHAQSITERGLIIVSHGNLIGSLIAQLIGGHGMMTHNNTGVSHLQLFTSKSHVTIPNSSTIHNERNIYTYPKTQRKQYRVASIQYVNSCVHLLSQPELITGNDVFKDCWIQDFITTDTTDCNTAYTVNNNNRPEVTSSTTSLTSPKASGGALYNSQNTFSGSTDCLNKTTINTTTTGKHTNAYEAYQAKMAQSTSAPNSLKNSIKITPNSGFLPQINTSTLSSKSTSPASATDMFSSSRGSSKLSTPTHRGSASTSNLQATLSAAYNNDEKTVVHSWLPSHIRTDTSTTANVSEKGPGLLDVCLILGVTDDPQVISTSTTTSPKQITPNHFRRNSMTPVPRDGNAVLAAVNHAHIRRRSLDSSPCVYTPTTAAVKGATLQVQTQLEDELDENGLSLKSQMDEEHDKLRKMYLLSPR